MSVEYKRIVEQTHVVNSIADLYDLVIDSKYGDPCLLVSMGTQCAKNILYGIARLDIELNIEHLSRKGIIFSEDDDIGMFRDEHFDDWLFDSVTARYCSELNTEEHPIPMFLRFSFNDKRDWKNDFSIDEEYCNVMNSLAIADNRKLLETLTPEILDSYRKANKPILFHNTDDDYFVDYDDKYNQPYHYKVIVPEGMSSEEAKEAIKIKLIEHELL